MRSRPALAVVQVDGRRFRVIEDADYPGVLVGFVHPVGRLRPSRPLHRRTEMRFKFLSDTEGNTRGLVANIAVDAERRGQGWATSLVRVLLQLYPDTEWAVESPNEKSGQLFLHLARVHPGHVRPPYEDETLAVGDPRRYKTSPPG